MTDLVPRPTNAFRAALCPTSRQVRWSAPKLVSALGILCLQLACSSDPDDPNGSAGKAAGGASGGSAPTVGGSTAAGMPSTFGGTGGSSSSTPPGGTAGTTSTGGTVSATGGAPSGGASSGRGGNATAGSSAGSGGKSGGSGGASGGGAGGSTSKAGAGGTAGAPGTAGSAGSPSAGASGGGSYNPCPTNGNPCKIVPMGDSITVGIGTGATGGGYRIELFKKATAAGKKIEFDGVGQSTQGCSATSNPQNPPAGFVNKHSACSGWTIQQIGGMVTTSLALKPDIILLMAGTNDARNASGAPMRLGMLLDQIFAADSHVLVVVAKLTPYPGGASGVMTINNAIPDLVQTRAAAGKHIMMVDMSAGYPDNSLPDGIHPNQAGYVFMSDVWYKAIGSLLP